MAAKLENPGEPRLMAIATIKQLCTPNAVVTGDSLVEQVAQIDDLAKGKVDGREFFRRNHFTSGLAGC